MDVRKLSDGLYMTEDQYLALDDATDGKYERLNGMVTRLRPPSSLEGADAGILDMAGGSDAHAALCMRLGLLIGPQLEDAPCMVYSGDRRLKLPQGNYLFPDVTVACGEETSSLPADPTVIIGVLSPATEKRDRTAKLAACDNSPVLKHGASDLAIRGSCFIGDRVGGSHLVTSYVPSTGSDRESHGQNVDRGIGITIMNHTAYWAYPFPYVQGE